MTIGSGIAIVAIAICGLLANMYSDLSAVGLLILYVVLAVVIVVILNKTNAT